jgi:tRNA (cytidine/uridine-2'-O-)-methyltransferase
MKNKKFNIVLVMPQIPQNTGNIGRLCVNTGTSMHLVKPLGFSLDDKYIKRAGLDYWSHLDLTVHESLNHFLDYAEGQPKYFFTTKTEQTMYECPFEDKAFLIFGNERSGLPEFIYRDFEQDLYTIPMNGNASRSLNLANSAAVVLYEGIRPI